MGLVPKHPMETNGKNGNGGVVSMIPTLVSTSIVVLTMFAGFWSLADPRASISEIKANFGNYLTLREHDQYKLDLDHQLKNIDKGLDEVHAEQRNRAGSIEHIHSLEKQIDELKKSHDELAKEINSSVTIADRMKELQNEISALRDKLLMPPK